MSAGAVPAAQPRSKLSDLIGKVTSNRLVRLAVGVVEVALGAMPRPLAFATGAALGGTAAVGAGIAVGAVGLGLAAAIVLGVVETAAVGLGLALGGGLAGMRLPHATVAGSSSLKRVAISAAVAGGVGLVATGTSFFLLPVLAQLVGGAAGIGEAGVVGAVAANIVHNRMNDVPMSSQPGVA